VFIDGPEQVVAYFQQLHPVADAFRPMCLGVGRQVGRGLVSGGYFGR
jgi:hypothetical protein